MTKFEKILQALKTTNIPTVIDLDHHYIKATGAKELAHALIGNTTLISLNLAYNYLHEEGVLSLAEVLKEHPTLTVLDLTTNLIGNLGAEVIAAALAGSKTLTTLNLSCNKINETGIERLMAILSTCPALSSLDLSWNPLGKEGVKELVRAFENFEGLSLDLTYNSMNDHAAQILVEALITSSQALSALSLGNNPLGDSGIIVMAQALKENVAIRHLDLYWTQSSARGAKALAKALETNDCLHSLNLGLNDIKDEGATAIAEMLSLNPSLQKLELVYTGIGDAGAEAFSKAFVYNTALNTLNLRSNKITDRGVTALSNALVINQSLRSLDLSDNLFGKDGVEALTNALEKNTSLIELRLQKKHGNHRLYDLLKRNQDIQDESLEAKSKLEGIINALLSNEPSTALQLKIENFMTYVEELRARNLEAYVLAKIKRILKITILEYYARDHKQKRDYNNMLRLFLLLPSIEEGFSNIFTHCLGAYYLLPLKEDTLKEGPSKLRKVPYDFENIYASKEDIFKKILKRFQEFYIKDRTLLPQIQAKFFPELSLPMGNSLIQLSVFMKYSTDDELSPRNRCCECNLF